MVCGIAPRSRESILEVRVGSLESTLSPINTHTAGLESQFALMRSEFDAAAVELESTEHRSSSPEDVASLVREEGQSQRPQICMVKAVRSVANVGQAAVESNVQSLRASEPAFCGDV